MHIVKAHAYGNDFLYVQHDAVTQAGVDPVALARRVCARHTGIGADGLILWTETADGAHMELLNADGSYSEVSGNGVRGLAALLARHLGAVDGRELTIATDAGPKQLTLEASVGATRFLFRAQMGRPTGLRQETIDVAGETVTLAVLAVGNPQAVLLDGLDRARLDRIGPALQTHAVFPDGVNFEIVDVVAPDRLRILIWERGVGPTESSGTGSCASAVAAVRFGGANRDVVVEAPGGAQRVQWLDDEEIVLTGWAEVTLDGEWLGALA